MEEGQKRSLQLNRRPLQGVWNIIRFNWHFYVLAATLLVLLFWKYPLLPDAMQPIALGLGTAGMLSIVLSLSASYYVYDYSNLYQLNWLPDISHTSILNINAGFDETSDIIHQKFEGVKMVGADFYDEKKHTEISIKRARKAYPPRQGSFSVSTNKLPFANGEFDMVLAILSAHEIRDMAERIRFFGEIKRVSKTTATIVVTEHLRDFNNFFVYTIGFFHFHSKQTWKKTFRHAGLLLQEEKKINPFVTTFILTPDGDTL